MYYIKIMLKTNSKFDYYSVCVVLKADMFSFVVVLICFSFFYCKYSENNKIVVYYLDL